MREKIAADEVREGDFLPALDNGYVFEVDSDPDVRGDYNVNIFDGMLMICFHDQGGNENYLVVYAETEIEVERN